MNKEELWSIALALENDSEFCTLYKLQPTVAQRRSVIGKRARALGSPCVDVGDREQIRRYFDTVKFVNEHWFRPAGGDNSRADDPTIEFWADEEPKKSVVAVTIGDPWDASFATHDQERRANHGKIWSGHELVHLRGMFLAGRSLESMSIELQRPADGIITKLVCTLKCLYQETCGNPYTFRYVVRQGNARKPNTTPKPKAAPDAADPVPQPTNLTKLEKLMANNPNIIKIETKTFVNGTDVSEMSDAAVYSLIADQEAVIAELEKIKTKPKKLTEEIAKRQAGIDALVGYLDSKADVKA